jgi:hypothetical protein
VQRGQPVLVDTNIIIEAFRTGCWTAVAAHFPLETVEKCYEEALTGDPLRPGYVRVDANELRSGLSKRHAVSEGERIRLAVQVSNISSLHAGERDLFAHALARTDAWNASCSDRAAVNTALDLSWEERLVTLEDLARKSGVNPELKYHFTERWLSEVRTTYKMEHLK